MSQFYIQYGNNTYWDNWLSHNSPIYFAWGIAIILLTGIYTLASVAFGLRFSNLTNRGIVTCGPYRFIKHPAYVCKNISWWLIAVPFVVTTTYQDALKCCLSLLLLNGIYFLRAVTEERHLAADSDYRAYQQHIKTHGLVARMRSFIQQIIDKRGLGERAAAHTRRSRAANVPVTR